MPRTAATPRSAALPRVLAVLSILLAAAFVYAPRILAGGDFTDESELRASLRPAFVEYWRSGGRDFTPSLERIVDFWLRYHLAKAVIAAVLLVALVALAVVLWRAFLRAGGTALLASGTVVSVLAVVASLLVMANIQGAVAPFSSLLPMVVDSPTDTELADTLGQIRQRLADHAETPVLDVITEDFARYHAAMAVIAACVAVLLIAASALSWITFAKASDSRARRVLASFGIASALFALAMIVVAVANTGTAADPTPALSAFFDGGW
ncbi:hypothetical protein [Nocardia sp. NPDC050406]|uniref:hypothetical protein n=1 Tax=Nocardia sp. NPDC050406 TaxID=3364318 RepID=UPI0037BBDE90